MTVLNSVHHALYQSATPQHGKPANVTLVYNKTDNSSISVNRHTDCVAIFGFLCIPGHARCLVWCQRQSPQSAPPPPRVPRVSCGSAVDWTMSAASTGPQSFLWVCSRLDYVCRLHGSPEFPVGLQQTGLCLAPPRVPRLDYVWRLHGSPDWTMSGASTGPQTGLCLAPPRVPRVSCGSAADWTMSSASECGRWGQDCRMSFGVLRTCATWALI